jgi:hypothetical protein
MSPQTMVKVDLPEHVKTEEWSRLPKPRHRLLGLSRTTLLELSNSRKIRTIAIKKPGAIRGIRLVFMPSLLKYLNSLGE